MSYINTYKGDSALLFFILDFLLLFYDSSSIGICSRRSASCTKASASRDSSILFFILIYLLLFYH
jgi:hypothetical protein